MASVDEQKMAAAGGNNYKNKDSEVDNIAEIGNAAVLDPTEVSLGIQSYLTPGTGFSAVSKARYSDFLVYEVSVSGEVARLTDLGDGPVSVTATTATEEETDKDNRTKEPNSAETSDHADGGVKRKRDDDNNGKEDESKNAKKPSLQDYAKQKQADEWNSFRSELQERLNKNTSLKGNDVKNEYDPAQRIIDFAKAERGNPDQKFFEIPLLSSATKKDRAEWHTWIRSPLSPLNRLVVTDTHKKEPASAGIDSGGNDKDNDVHQQQYVIRLWHKDFERGMPGYGKFDHNYNNKRNNNNNKKSSRHQGPQDKPYLRFVLYKENLDTAAALSQLQRRFEDMGGRGRGGRGRGRGGRGGSGGGRWQQQQGRLRIGHAGMKDKRGVTCQFVTVPASTSIPVLLSLNRPHPSSRPHYGGGDTQLGGAALLRVGNFSFVKEELMLGRLQGNRFEVVLRHIRPASSEAQESTERSQIKRIQEKLKEEVSTAAQDLAKFGFINYFGTQRFGKFHDTHLTGMAVLQGNYKQAVDVILQPKPDETGERQNVREARQSWEQRFKGLGDGDKSAKERAEHDAAQRLLDECGRFFHNEKAVCHSLARNPLDYKKAYSCISKTMRMMFVHAFQSLIWNHLATYRINVLYHKERNRGVVVGDLLVLNEENCEEYENRQLPQVHIVTEDDVAQERYSLADVVLPLVGAKTIVPSYGTKILHDFLEKHGITLKSLQEYSDRDFSCSGDYRKLLCIPKDVDVEMLEYTDPLEPLVQTDLMRLNNISIGGSATKGTKPPPDSPLLGARIGFTLPSSAYATIALREFMKRPTSSEYQSELKLGGSSAKSEQMEVEDDGAEEAMQH